MVQTYDISRSFDLLGHSLRRYTPLVCKDNIRVCADLIPLKVEITLIVMTYI